MSIQEFTSGTPDNSNGASKVAKGQQLSNFKRGPQYETYSSAWLKAHHILSHCAAYRGSVAELQIHLLFYSSMGLLLCTWSDASLKRHLHQGLKQEVARHHGCLQCINILESLHPLGMHLVLAVLLCISGFLQTTLLIRLLSWACNTLVTSPCIKRLMKWALQMLHSRYHFSDEQAGITNDKQT